MNKELLILMSGPANVEVDWRTLIKKPKLSNFMGSTKCLGDVLPTNTFQKRNEERKEQSRSSSKDSSASRKDSPGHIVNTQRVSAPKSVPVPSEFDEHDSEKVP